MSGHVWVACHVSFHTICRLCGFHSTTTAFVSSLLLVFTWHGPRDPYHFDPEKKTVDQIAENDLLELRKRTRLPGRTLLLIWITLHWSYVKWPKCKIEPILYTVYRTQCIKQNAQWNLPTVTTIWKQFSWQTESSGSSCMSEQIPTKVFFNVVSRGYFFWPALTRKLICQSNNDKQKVIFKLSERSAIQLATIQLALQVLFSQQCINLEISASVGRT